MRPIDWNAIVLSVSILVVFVALFVLVIHDSQKRYCSSLENYLEEETIYRSRCTNNYFLLKDLEEHLIKQGENL